MHVSESWGADSISTIRVGELRGIREGNGDDYILLIKTDTNGNKLWIRAFYSDIPSKINHDCPASVQQTNDGGYIVAGTRDQNHYPYSADIWLIKTDTNGNNIWDMTLEDAATDEYGDSISVKQTSDGGYILVSSTSKDKYELGKSDIYLARIDANGNKLWEKTFSKSGFDHCDSIQQTTDGGYIIAGTMNSFGSKYNSNIWLIKTDANGNKVWDKTFG